MSLSNQFSNLQHLWLLNAAFGFALAIIAHFIFSKTIYHMVLKSEQTKFIYDEALLKAITAPVKLLIWSISSILIFSSILHHFNEAYLLSYLLKIKSLLITVSLCWVMIRFIHNIEQLHIRRCVKNSVEVDKTLVHATTQLVTISSIVVTILTVMQIFGLPISGLLTFGGIGGAAIAFASRDLLANLFGGLVVYLDRPFKIGDWIRSPDKQIEGTVEMIGWRVTCIRTFDKRPLYVPNGVFLTISVENASRMLNRRIKTHIGIRYQDADKMDDITLDVKNMLIKHPDIDSSQTMIVNFTEFGPSSLNFMVYTFTKTTNWVRFQAVQHDVFIKILSIVAKHRAECAFPTQTLHLKDESIAAMAAKSQL